jgi:hypothetical protein
LPAVRQQVGHRLGGVHRDPAADSDDGHRHGVPILKKGRDELVYLVGSRLVGCVDELEHIARTNGQAVADRGIGLEVVIHQEDDGGRLACLVCLGPQTIEQAMKLTQRGCADVVATDVSDQFDAGIQYVCHD